MAEQLNIFEPSKRKSGLLYLSNYLTISDQKDLLNDLRTVVKQSPLFTPAMSSGAPFKYKMTNIGDLGWNSDRKGYRYESKHPVTGQPYPEIPSSLRSMIDDLSGKFGEKIRPDAVLLNWYSNGAKLGLHQDSTEKVSKPVVSLSLGDRGVFAIDTTGSRDRNTAMRNLERINVNSGDAIVFGGDLRNAYHAVERIDAGTAPPELGLKNSGRINLTARQVNEAPQKYMTANKKINTSISIGVSEAVAKPPKLTSDIIADYLKVMGGEAMLVKPGGSQYNPDRKGRVVIGDRMTTAEKFGQAGDVGLNNEFTKLPEVHARFDDRMTALQVQKEIATGKLTTQKFFEVPSKEIANQAADEIRRSPDIKLGRGEIIDVRPSGKGYEVVAVKQYQPIPSRGNTLARTYNLNNDPTGTFVGFNKPEEAYSAPKTLKELQGELRKSYQAFGLKSNASMPELEAAIAPIVSDVKASPQLRDSLQNVLVDIQGRNAPEPVMVERGWDNLPQRSLISEEVFRQIQQTAIAPDAQTRINAARDTGGYSNAVGEPFNPPRTNVKPIDISQPRFAAEMGTATNPTGISDRGYYNKVAAVYADDNFGLGDRLKPFPDFYDLKRQSVAEGVRPEALRNYIKGKANAPKIEAGIMAKPELPMTARLGQEYISPKTGNVGTVESVGKKGVKLNVDGQVVPVEYKILERLKYTGNKGHGFAAPAALRPAFGGFAGGTLGAIAFKQLAKSAGLNEDQQNIAASVGGVAGSLTGGSLSLFKPTTELKLPTPQQFARNVMGLPAVNDSGMFLSAEGRNNMRLNQLDQYDVKPVLGEIAVLGTDLLTPHPYGIATVPAARMATDSWKNNYDAIAERGLSAVKTTAAGATSAIKDFTYQTLTQLGRSAGLPFPMTEQAVGQVLDAIPNSQQIMSMGDRAKARLSRRYSSESGMVMSAGDRSQTLNSRQSTGEIFNIEPRSLTDLQKQRAKLDTYNPDAKPIQAIKEFKPVPKLSLEESAAMLSMKPNEYKGFQEKVYAETDYLNSKPYQEVSERIAQQQFKQQQTYFDAMKAWNKAGDPSVPMPSKQDFVQPMKRSFDMQSTLSEASLRAKKATTSGFGKSAPKASNFIAESVVEAAAKSSGATTAQVKAQIASQRSAGIAPDLNVATEAISSQKQSKQLATRSQPQPVQSRELAVRSLTELKLQTKEPSTKVLSRQQSDGMIATPSESMIKAGMKSQRVKLGDRIGTSGIGLVMDTAQAANVLTESVSRGENAPTALSRAGLSVGAGYLATGLASFIPNTYVRTAAQLVGGIGAVIGADKALDQIVGRNEAKEQKYSRDLSKLDLQPTDESQQWKPFANDSNIAAAYGNSLAAQVQSNLDYRPAARSLANLANRDAIENARYQSERDTSIKTGMDAKSNKSIAFEDRGNGVTVGYIRNRGYTSTESRVLALQNLANESGYEVPRTGKFESKTLDALERLGYSQNQITEYIQGKTKAIGKPRQVENARSAVRQVMSDRSGEKVTSQQLSAALSAQRKAEGLKFGEKLSDAAVAGAFNSLAGKTLTELRQSPIKSKSLQRFGSAVGIGK